VAGRGPLSSTARQGLSGRQLLQAGPHVKRRGEDERLPVAAQVQHKRMPAPPLNASAEAVDETRATGDIDRDIAGPELPHSASIPSPPPQRPFDVDVVLSLDRECSMTRVPPLSTSFQIPPVTRVNTACRPPTRRHVVTATRRRLTEVAMPASDELMSARGFR
jgi:hypothetical protein